MSKNKPYSGRCYLRRKINATALIETLQRHALGEIEMSPSQVRVALALLKKILPDRLDPVGKKPAKAAVVSHEAALRELE